MAVNVTQTKQAIIEKMAQIKQVADQRKIDLPPVILTNRKFKIFQRTYRHDPVAFVHDCIQFKSGQGPTKYQERIIGDLPTVKREVVWGPRGLGKTTLLSWLILWALLTVDDVKVPITAGAWRQLESFLWPEVHKWIDKLNWSKIGREPFSTKVELRSTDIVLSKTCLTVTASPADPKKIEGAHAEERVLVIFDESKSVRDDVFDAIEGAFSKTEEPLAIALSTPGGMLGRFYEMCTDRIRYSRWHPYHITMEDQLQAGRLTQDQIDGCLMQWGEQSPLYRQQILGEFAADDTRVILPLEKVMAAVERWRVLDLAGQLPMSVGSIGLDVARMGEDKTVMAYANGPILLRFDEHAKRDTMEVTGFAASALRNHPQAKATVDVIGLGAGVYDRLREQGYDVLSFNAGERSEATDQSGKLKFANKRAEAWWKLRDWLDEDDSEIALPNDARLLGELTSVVWKETSGGKVLVESKDDIRKRLGRSTDKADAAIMALLGEKVAAHYATTVSSYEEFLEKYGDTLEVPSEAVDA